MKKILIGIGVAVLVLTAIASAAPKPEQQAAAEAPRGAPAALPSVGETASKGGWQVTLVAYGPYEEFIRQAPSPPPQGKLVIVELAVKNLQQRTSNFTGNDFEIQTRDSRKFAPDRRTGAIDKGFVISQEVQPGLTTNNRVVFDIDPAARDLTFVALGVQFKLPS